MATAEATRVDPRILGRQLRQLRKMAGATQFDVARETQISAQRICAIENGNVLQFPEDDYQIIRDAVIRMIHERLKELLGVVADVA
jgi:transcriptional regulator with XRE-family HTH domain